MQRCHSAKYIHYMQYISSLSILDLIVFISKSSPIANLVELTCMRCAIYEKLQLQYNTETYFEYVEPIEH